MKQIGEIASQKDRKPAVSRETHPAPIQARVKTYRMLDAKNEKRVGIHAIPTELVTKQEDFEVYLIKMLEAANREEMSRGEKILLHEALERNNVTVDEAYQAFWEAYGDPYLSGGSIRFRNMMKYIKDERGTLLSLNEVISLVTEKGFDQERDFEITNVRDSKGRRKWRKL